MGERSRCDEPLQSTHLGRQKNAIINSAFALRLEHLPIAIKLQDLLNFFSSKGNVTWIAIHKRKGGQLFLSGKVVFNPPPKEDFWTDRTVVLSIPTPADPKQKVDITVTPWLNDPIARMREGQNECNYPIVTQVELAALEFGSLAKANTMAIVKTLTSTSPGDQLLEWNFASKKLTVHFSFPISHQDKTGKCCYKLVADFSEVKQV